MPALTLVPSAKTSAPADGLDLTTAVIGEDGLVLTRGEEGELSLYGLEAGVATLLGRFDDPADAWRLVDVMDDQLAAVAAAA